MERICLVINRFLFYINISEIINMHGFKSFSVCDMNLKFVSTMTARSNTSCTREIKARFPHSVNFLAPSALHYLFLFKVWVLV